MKTINFLFFLIFLAPATHAQNYMITFAGTGAATSVDSVHIQNLTQCTDTNLIGTDVLSLSVIGGINTYTDEGTASINIFPNPAAGSCTASFEAPSNENTTIEIYDAIGKRIAQRQQFLSKGKHSFNLQGLGSGVVYLLKIQSEKYSCTAKLISNSEELGDVEINEITATSHNTPTGKLKGGKNVVAMLYHTSDQLKFTGYSGIYKTVFMLMPTQGQTVTFNFIPCTDADNNNYAVVQIGTQVWMEENLKTTIYSNGASIPNIPDSTQWWNTNTGAYCYYNNDVINATIYGELYNWFAVSDSRNICPAGWHSPTDAEWTIMENYMGGNIIAGGKLKENCSTHWISPNSGATNESGFTALPGGIRGSGNAFGELGYTGYWWSSTESFPGWTAWQRYLGFNYIIIVAYDNSEAGGLSVRCIRD